MSTFLPNPGAINLEEITGWLDCDGPCHTLHPFIYQTRTGNLCAACLILQGYTLNLMSSLPAHQIVPNGAIITGKVMERKEKFPKHDQLGGKDE